MYMYTHACSEKVRFAFHLDHFLSFALLFFAMPNRKPEYVPLLKNIAVFTLGNHSLIMTNIIIIMMTMMTMFNMISCC